MEKTLELLQRVHQGDKAAREKLAEENMGLVYTVVRRFQDRGCEREDLIQIGSIGLLKAIDHFDLSYEVRFSTYAVPMITGEIRRYLRDDGMIKVSRILKQSAAQICHVKEELEKKNGTEPTVMEIARESGICPEEITMALEAVSEVASLSQPVYSGDGSEVLLQERLIDPNDPQESLLNRLLLRQLMKGLSSEEQQMIVLRYIQECTQGEIAARMGMTQVQVSRKEKKILQKLREQASV